MDDLISRDDVYDVLKKVNIREMPIYVFDKLWNGIRDLPSIEPEERTAKVDAGHKSVITGMLMDGHCMQCGRYVMDEDDYCPGCGARLEWK